MAIRYLVVDGLTAQGHPTGERVFSTLLELEAWLRDKAHYDTITVYEVGTHGIEKWVVGAFGRRHKAACLFPHEPSRTPLWVHPLIRNLIDAHLERPS